MKHVAVSNLLCSYNAGWFTFRDMGTFSSFCCFSEDPIGFVMQYNLQAIQQLEKTKKKKLAFPKKSPQSFLEVCWCVEHLKKLQLTFKNRSARTTFKATADKKHCHRRLSAAKYFWPACIIDSHEAYKPLKRGELPRSLQKIEEVESDAMGAEMEPWIGMR